MKKFVAMMLVLTLVIGVVSGCGGETKDASSSTNENSEERLENLNPPGEYPIVKNKIDVKVQMLKDALVEDLSTNDATKMFEEKTNIHLDMEVTSSDNNSEKCKLMLASGDYPEVFLSGPFTNNDIMDYGVKQGIFLPIENILEKYAPRVNEVNTEEVKGFLQHLKAPDGHIYGLPSMNECYHCAVSQKAWINTEWLDRLGLEKPKTVEEFYQVLKAFKEQDANGNGDPDDEVPFSGAIDSWHMGLENWLMNPFIICDESGVNGLNYFKVNEDRSLTYAPIEKEWREGIKWMSKLYKEGLIDPLAFSQKTEQLKQIGNKEGDVILGGFAAGHLQMGTSLIDEDPGCNALEYDVLEPLEGFNGEINTPYFAPAVSGAKFVITDKCKNPEAMIRWVDYAWSEEGTVVMEWGKEGDMWESPKNGELDLLGNPAKWVHLMTCEGGEIHNYSWRQAGPDCRTFKGYRSRWNVDQNERTQVGYELYLYRRSKPYMKYIPKQEQVFVPPFIAEEVVQEAASLKATIQEYVNMSRAQFITGELDVEGKDWDSYLDKMKSMGVERYLEIYQNAWAEKVKLMQ